MPKLSSPHFPLAAHLFSATTYGGLAASTLEGTHPGRVLVDDLTRPRAALICARAGVGYYFLAGEPDADFLSELHRCFLDDFVPAQKAALDNPEVLLFFPPGEGWQAALLEAFADCRPIVIRKKRFTLPAEAAQRLRARPIQPLGGLRLAPYTADLLAAQPEIGEEAALFYGSHESFLRHSLGACLLDGETLASHCHAVFTGAGEAEISIATAPAYRRRGLAEIAAAAFIQSTFERGLAPIWGCWPENVPSVTLAGKLGFVEAADQPVLLWVDAEDWNR